MGQPGILKSAAFSGMLLFSAEAVSSSELTHFAWTHRPIVISASSFDVPALQQQREALAAVRDDLAERDVVVIEIVGHHSETIVGPPVFVSADLLRRELGLTGAEFGVVLVGKDTGIKLWSRTPVDAERIFALIDGMPMRQREMRSKEKDG